MNHLLLFTISPVQPFIASARKTRDLYAGSQILSEMAKAAANEAVNQKLILVFPTTTEGRSFPNRFVAKIEGTFSDKELQKKGEAIRYAAIKRFNDFAEEALKKVSIDTETLGSFWKQIENYWDFNWFFYAYEGKYKVAYEEIEPLMAALKKQRTIKNNFEKPGRKCSLDGQNNALFKGKETKNGLLNSQAIEVDNTWLKPNEGLSAISFVKRAYEARAENDKKIEFPSTIEVALKKQLRKLDKTVEDGYKDLFSNKYSSACIQLLTEGYIEKVKLNNKEKDWVSSFNEEFWVEDNLTEKNIPNLTQLGIVREVHRKHLKPHLKDRYYALVAFDGDKMGKLISGALLKDKNTNLGGFQGKVSELLIHYSKWINDNLEDKIDIVYAGGDDFLGFVCLHDLFGVGRTLRQEFKKQVNDKLQEEYKLVQEFTFSMGITIAHYKAPLSIVLQTTREMEKTAKNETKGNRNAFAIAVLKHSGENHQAYYRWYEKDEDGKENMKAWGALEKLVGHLQNDCSETFIRVLERELRLLQDKDGNIENADMITLELGRLAQRSLNEKARREKKGPEVKENVEMLISTKIKKSGKSYVNFNNSFEAMKVAMFLKRRSGELKKIEN